MLHCIRSRKRSDCVVTKNYKRSSKKNKTLLIYGTCIECCRLNNSPPRQLNKVICVNCGKKLAIADISDDVSVIEKTEKIAVADASDNNGKCRLCLNTITNEVIPIWGDGCSYSEKIYLCCAINVSKDDELPNDLCNDCVSQLNSAYDFRTLCLKRNADIITSSLNANDNKSVSEYDEQLQISYESNAGVEDIPNYEFDNNLYDDASIDECDVEEDNENEIVNQLICPKCPMICHTEKEFNVHRDSHCIGPKSAEGDFPIIFCQVDGCDKQFVKFKDRERHENSHHKDKSNIYNYICPHCAQLVKRLRTFNYHAYFLHSGDEVICNQCGKLMNREQLKVHNRKVHMQETVTCPDCGLSINKYNFKRHMKQVHDEKDKLNCQFCNKKFANKWNLQTHVRTHTGEMPYTCPDCGLAFCHKVTMKNHRLHVHNIDMFEKKEKKMVNRRRTPIESHL